MAVVDTGGGGLTQQAIDDANAIRAAAGLPPLTEEEIAAGGGTSASGGTTGAVDPQALGGFLSALGSFVGGSASAVQTAQQQTTQPTGTTDTTGGTAEATSSGTGGVTQEPAPQETPAAPPPEPSPNNNPLAQVGATPIGQVAVTSTPIAQQLLNSDFLGAGATISPEIVDIIANSPNLMNDTAIQTGVINTVNNGNVSFINNEVAPGTVQRLGAASTNAANALIASGQATVGQASAVTQELKDSAGQAFDRSLHATISQLENSGRHDAAVILLAQGDQLRQQYVDSILPLTLADGRVFANVSPFAFLNGQVGSLLELPPISRAGGQPTRSLIGEGGTFGFEGQGQDFLGAGRLIQPQAQEPKQAATQAVTQGA